MQGYRLAKDGTPTLLYRHGQTMITDTLTSKGKGMRRRLEFTGSKGKLWVRLATANIFLTEKTGIWSTDAKLSIIAPTGKVRRIEGMSELIVPVNFDSSGKAMVYTEWQW